MSYASGASTWRFCRRIKSTSVCAVYMLNTTTASCNTLSTTRSPNRTFVLTVKLPWRLEIMSVQHAIGQSKLPQRKIVLCFVSIPSPNCFTWVVRTLSTSELHTVYLWRQIFLLSTRQQLVTESGAYRSALLLLFDQQEVLGLKKVGSKNR